MKKEIKIKDLDGILEDLRLDMINDLDSDNNIEDYIYNTIKRNVELFITKLKDRLKDKDYEK